MKREQNKEGKYKCRFCPKYLQWIHLHEKYHCLDNPHCMKKQLEGNCRHCGLYRKRKRAHEKYCLNNPNCIKTNRMHQYPNCKLDIKNITINLDMKKQLGGNCKHYSQHEKYHCKKIKKNKNPSIFENKPQPESTINKKIITNYSNHYSYLKTREYFRTLNKKIITNYNNHFSYLKTLEDPSFLSESNEYFQTFTPAIEGIYF